MTGKIRVNVYIVRYNNGDVWFQVRTQRGLTRRFDPLPVVTVGSQRTTQRSRHDTANLLRWVRDYRRFGLASVERSQDILA